MVTIKEKIKDLTAIFEPAEEGGYVCWFKKMPKVMSQGNTLEEARENLVDALNLVLEYKKQNKINRIAKDNPDLSNNQIRGILSGLQDIEDGNTTEYKRGISLKDKES